MNIFRYFLLLFSSIYFSQSRTITGVVSEDTNKPLESANVIAKPLQEKASLKFAIATESYLTP